MTIEHSNVKLVLRIINTISTGDLYLMSKLLRFGDSARDRIKVGVNILADAVSATMGPKGRNAVLGKSFGPPAVTKDGVTVAKEVDLKDELENIGAQLVKEVAQKTAEDAGDGTTTATVLARAIYNEGMKLVAAGHDPMTLKRGIDKSTKTVVAYLESISQEVTDKQEIGQVGAISANNDLSIGKLIAEAMDKVGRDGIITVEEGTSPETTLEAVKGMQFDRGYISPYFVTHADTLTTEYKNVYILICENPISRMKDILPLLETLAKGNRPLLVIAENVEGEALAGFIVNKVQGSFFSVAVKAPSFGDKRKALLEDIAVITGATVVNEETGKLLKDIQIDDLGQAASITVTKDTTTIVGGLGDKENVNSRVNQIRTELEQSAGTYDIEHLKARLAKLVSGVAVINVGGSTEVEIKEKKDRVEDALNATQAAVEEGIVPGGGVALLRAAQNLDTDVTKEEQYGLNILKKALEEPVKTITANAGQPPEVIVEKLLESADPKVGFNAATEVVEDLMQAGVIDPTKVVRSAVENAASIAGLMLTTEVLITEESKTIPADDNTQ